MGISKIDQESLLRRIHSDPAAAIAKQLLVPAAATETLVRLSRKVPGIFTLENRLELSRETASALHYIAEHNYLAYLALTDRFDIIRRFFWEEEALKQQIAYVQEIEKEKKEQERQYMQNLILTQEQFLINKQQRDKINLEQKQNEEKALLNAGLYQYYREIEQQIYERFYFKQIEVFTKAFIGREARMDRAIDIINNDSEISPEDKREFLEMRNNYRQEFEVLNQILVFNQDNSINHQGLKNKYDAAKRIDDKYKNLFVSKLEQYRNHPELRGILQEERNAVILYEAELAQNEAVRDQELAEIKPHLENFKAATKEDIKLSMERITDYLEEPNLKGLSENDQQLFQKTFMKLSELGYRISLINDEMEIKKVSQQFFDEISNIKHIIKPSILRPDLYHKFESEFNTFNKLHTSFKDQTKETENLPTPFKNNAEEEKTTGSLEKRARQTTLNMKDTLKFFRTEELEHKIDIESKSAKTLGQEQIEAEEKIELDEDMQESFANFVESFSTAMKKIFKKNTFNEIELTLASQLKETSEEIANTMKQAIDKSKMEFLRENIEALNKKHPELKGAAKELDTIIDKMENSSSPRP